MLFSAVVSAVLVSSVLSAPQAPKDPFHADCSVKWYILCTAVVHQFDLEMIEIFIFFCKFHIIRNPASLIVYPIKVNPLNLELFKTFTGSNVFPIKL